MGFIDCDNSGKLSIITANGSTVDHYKKGGDLMITLYRADNQAGVQAKDCLKFKDITTQAGLTQKGWGMGVAVADFDNDGLLDIYVTGYGGNVLYRNTGNCKFEDVTEKAGVRAQGFSTGASWGDYDRDGWVDLFVPRYVHVDIDHLPEFGRDKFCRYRGIMVQCGPAGLPGESDLLFHNRGDGTFEDVSKKAGVSDENHYFGIGQAETPTSEPNDPVNVGVQQEGQFGPGSTLDTIRNAALPVRTGSRRFSFASNGMIIAAAARPSCPESWRAYHD